MPLVRAALDRGIYEAARACAEGKPPDDVRIESLKANLHAPDAKNILEHLRDLARLSRFVGSAPRMPELWDARVRFVRDQLAWFDLATRRLRRGLESQSSDLQAATRTVLDRAQVLRDSLSKEFAEGLAHDWPVVAANKDLRLPLGLHQVGRSLLARLLADGRRVLLVVLDGCDLSTFLELVDSAPEHMGLAVPASEDATLRADLAAIGALHLAVSPVPTVTSHARRALFAGEIPGNTALDDTEAVAANATADQQAFQRNSALQNHPRRLFLKGDLADGSAIEAVLRQRNPPLVAVVFNGVDDALLSKEMTPIPPWSLAGLGGGALGVLNTALDEGWTVVVTADHGHTPYLRPDRKVAASSLGTRFHDSPQPQGVQFDAGPLPRKPLWIQHLPGAWSGQQHRGFHGGADPAEVVVPLAFWSRVVAGQGRPRSPGWWWGMDQDLALPMELVSAPPSNAAMPQGVPNAVRLALAGHSDWLQALELLADREVLALPQLATSLRRSPVMVGGMMSRIAADLARNNVEVPFVDEEANGERLFRWRVRR
jgi:hypothetical protein